MVGFAPAVLDDPSLLTVSPLDLDAAAQTLATVLRRALSAGWTAPCDSMLDAGLPASSTLSMTSWLEAGEYRGGSTRTQRS